MFYEDNWILCPWATFLLSPNHTYMLYGQCNFCFLLSPNHIYVLGRCNFCCFLSSGIGLTSTFESSKFHFYFMASTCIVTCICKCGVVHKVKGWVHRKVEFMLLPVWTISTIDRSGLLLLARPVTVENPPMSQAVVIFWLHILVYLPKAKWLKPSS